MLLVIPKLRRIRYRSHGNGTGGTLCSGIRIHSISGLHAADEMESNSECSRRAILQQSVKCVFPEMDERLHHNISP